MHAAPMIRLRYSLLFFLLLFCIIHSNAQEQQKARNYILKIYPASTFYLNGWIYDYSFGIGIEKLWNQNPHWGMEIPLFYGYKDDGTGMGSGTTFKNVIKIVPGLTYYPFGQKRWTYGIGLSTLIMYGTRNEYFLNSPAMVHSEATFLQIGIMANNSLQYQISKQLNLGIKAAFGPSMINQFTDAFPDKVSGMNPMSMIHFNLHLGYHF